MTLLVSFGYLVFSLMRGSLELWRKGETGRDLNEKSAAVFDVIVRDFESLHVGREGKLLSEIAFEDARGNGKMEGISRHARVVRSVDRAEEVMMLKRLAPSDATTAPELEKRAERPQGTGLFEIAYSSARDPKQQDPAIQILYRGVRAFGDPNTTSFFSEGFFSKKGIYGDSLRELTSGVLYFGLAFGRDRVESWEDDDESIPAVKGAPDHCWDSTRGMLTRNDEIVANRFGLALGGDSVNDTRDDVFPRKMLITLVLERDSQDSRLTFLRSDLDEEEKRIEVDDPKRLPRSYPGYIKIEQEWIELSGVEGKVAVAKRRGARSTVQSSHKSGIKIHVGETFRTEVRLPQYREDWNAK